MDDELICASADFSCGRGCENIAGIGQRLRGKEKGGRWSHAGCKYLSQCLVPATSTIFDLV